MNSIFGVFFAFAKRIYLHAFLEILRRGIRPSIDQEAAQKRSMFTKVGERATK